MVALYSFPMVQSRLSDAHRAATNGLAENAPMEAINWIMIAVGRAFFLFWVGIVVLIALLAATSA